MGAIEQRWGLETAAVTALAAGADILLIANDRLPDGGSAARAALATIQQRLVSGRLDPERVEAALARALAPKARLGDGCAAPRRRLPARAASRPWPRR